MGGGIVTVNLGRLSMRAHSCTSDQGISSFSSVGGIIGSFTIAVLADGGDDDDDNSSLSAALADAAIFISDGMLLCLLLIGAADGAQNNIC